MVVVCSKFMGWLPCDKKAVVGFRPVFGTDFSCRERLRIEVKVEANWIGRSVHTVHREILHMHILGESSSSQGIAPSYVEAIVVELSSISPYSPQ